MKDALFKKLPIIIYESIVSIKGENVEIISIDLLENTYVESLTGYTKEELSDPLFWFSKIHEDDKHNILEKLSALKTDESTSCTYRFLTKDGSYLYLKNNVYILEKDGKKYMHDYSGGHITTEEAKQIIDSLRQELGSDRFRFYSGVSYRHLLVVKNININGLQTVAPHDIPDLQIDDYIPHGTPSSSEIVEVMKKAEKILENHEVNKKRIAEGKLPANSIWLWGQGYKPSMPTIKEAYGLEGSVISAVDLVKGIGKYAGLKVINVPGATGYLDTNYAGKVEYGMNSLHDGDFVYIHVEATDEASHEGSIDKKLRAIEDFDKFIAGGVLEGLKKFGDYTLMILPDHYNQVRLKKHTPEPVPFCGFSTKTEKRTLDKYSAISYSETLAQNSGLFFGSGSQLFKHFLNNFNML
ncbi:2,3-bisphosphoglycerate-independent phosphoglycerate mutase [Desulfurella sp.]|uniref:2,3-bisphosphoglycerate-independent phosphoglycerate mutase n=1 Tax=Desulfurella sp. TaxID=1962857 RepID=UPI0025BA7F5D|nr:2,3-bisphosphoglycerate-independent phosphoglycerate mutase [Desulfurella sp.]